MLGEGAVEALLDAAADGVAHDGLRVERADDGYVFETPAGRRSGLTEADLAEAAREDAPYVHDWYHWTRELGDFAPRRAFLRWIERADETPVGERYRTLSGEGYAREWGQLRVSVRLADDERVYDLRHVDDADTPADELDAYEDPRDARTLGKYDERGRYRPLKTAPSLDTGWAFPALDGRDVVDAVDFFYPATVANWHRERLGELDVDHWRQTADRQTGIYDVVSDLPRAAVDWMAEACCVDSQCLKRREWEYDADDELAVDGGDGEFPCREPCSLVVAAARTWTKLESEETQTYEFELTPSEKAQLEAVVDAVADGRVDDVREADVYEGANRYRVRYLRAKRFDDEGHLGGPGDGE